MLTELRLFQKEIVVSMPSYHKMDWANENLTLELEPRSIWKKCFKRRSPYLTGDFLDLELVVKSRNTGTDDYTYKWSLTQILSNNEKETRFENEGSFRTKSRGSIRCPLKAFLIVGSGEYHLTLTCVKSNDHSIGESQEMLIFAAPARDMYLATRSNAWMSGIIGGIIGVIAGIALAILTRGG